MCRHFKALGIASSQNTLLAMTIIGFFNVLLVHGYEQWGMEGLLSRLRGMFAFALYDSGRHSSSSPLTPHPLSLTPVYGVQTLPLGSYLTLQEGKLECKEYWQLSFDENPHLTEAEATEQLEALLQEAVCGSAWIRSRKHGIEYNE